MNNNYIPKFSERQIAEVYKKLTPINSRACNNMLFGPNSETYSGNYRGYSLKRSFLKDCVFENAIFDHTSLAGSTLEKVQFQSKCKIESLYMNKCTITDVLFQDNIQISNSSFSDSHLKNVGFVNNKIRSTFFENCYMDNCFFQDCVIRSTMFGGAFLYKCRFENCNMRNLNIEFSTMQECVLDGSCISFFQFPYIIGIFKDLSILKNVFLGKNDETPLSFSQYYETINDSIIYFTSLEEYFPLANLYYSKGETELCQSCIVLGIQKALIKNDIRMIDNYCKLGQFYDVLNISDIQKILREVDEKVEHITDKNLFSVLLKQSYELKGSIAQNNSKAKLEITINTNLKETDFDKVGKLCEDIDTIIIGIMPSKITTSYQISHNSPFEICLTCIGLTSDLIAISGFIYSYIAKHLKKSKTVSQDVQKYIERSNKEYIDSLNNQFDYFLKIIERTEKKYEVEIIEDFRAKIISAATDQISKDYALIISQSQK